MICCIGLIIGLMIGLSLGGIWTFVMPAIGFGVGLLIDRKLYMRSHTGNSNHKVETKKKKRSCCA